MLYYQIGNSTCVLPQADPHNLNLGTRSQLHALVALLLGKCPPRYPMDPRTYWKIIG
jgi:hypothetical protein